MSTDLRAAALFARALEQSLRAPGRRDALDLHGPGTTSLGAWFLGPKAENERLLLELATHAIRAHAKERREYYPDDPEWITREIKRSPAYVESVGDLRAEFERLIDRLHGSAPFYSYRYQAHMLWDVTLPGALGYLAALLYNQNNVAAEASPVTTLLEMQVGDDLCAMLGYVVPTPSDDTAATAPWGHITCDGSVANIESMWAARNVKYYPLALARAIAREARLAAARGVMIRLANGREVPLLEAGDWELLNIRADDTLALPARLQAGFEIDPQDLSAIMRAYAIQDLGMVEFHRRYLPDMAAPVVVGPATMHYSWPKAAALLGVGDQNLLRVPVDADGRLEIPELRATLEQCLADRRPVLQAVAVIGTTEESAVDPLADMVTLRDRVRRKGQDFVIHADAAWGGYFASVLRPPSSIEAQGLLGAEARHRRQFTPTMVMSRYVEKQYGALPQADSITVDPHKGGCIPYPAGGLCYRNSAMRNIVSFTAPVVFHGGVDPTVGVYGVEGSKPGAAAAAVYLSHRVMRPDQSGYGKLLGKCLFNSKRLYAELVTMARAGDPFIVVPFQRLPAERAGRPRPEVRAQLEFIRERIVPRTNDELIADRKAMALFRELGSDQTIIAYTFNFLNADGSRNADPAKLLALNTEIFNRLSLHPDPKKVRRTPMIVTSSSFDPATYGRPLVDGLKARLGIKGDPRAAVPFLISTTLDPWITDTATGNFIPRIIDILRRTVLAVIGEMEHGGAPPPPPRGKPKPKRPTPVPAGR